LNALLSFLQRLEHFVFQTPTHLVKEPLNRIQLGAGRWEPDEGQFAGVEQPPLVGRGPVGHEERPFLEAALNLTDKPPEALFVELGQEGGEALARKGAQGQIKVPGPPVRCCRNRS